MTEKVNGKAFAGEFLGKNLDFFIVTSTTDFTAGGNQTLFDNVVETISLNGQPIILAAPTRASNVTTLKFAIEHTGAWTAAGLKTALQAPGIALAAGSDTVVTLNSTLT